MKTQTQAPDSGSSPAPSDVDNLKHDFTQLRADVVSLFSHAFDVGKSGVGAIETGAADAMENLKDRMASLRRRGERKIEEHPFSSAMIAFGIGFLVAKLLHRRH